MTLPTMMNEECVLCPEGVLEPEYTDDEAACDECKALYAIEWDGEQVGEDLAYKMSWVATGIISKGEK